MEPKFREKEMGKLRKLREYARNIDMIIDLFGWRFVPLLASAPLRQV